MITKFIHVNYNYNIFLKVIFMLTFNVIKVNIKSLLKIIIRGVKMNLDSILDRGKPLPPRIVIYGNAGIGKTTWVDDFPVGKMIYVPVEDGITSLSGETNKTKKPETFKEVKDFIKQLIEEEHDYKVVVLDSCSKIEQLIFKEVEKEEKVINIAKIGWQCGYKLASGKLTNFLDLLDELRRVKKMIVVITSHSVVLTVKPPFGEPFDKFTFLLHKENSERLKEWADIILFMNYEFYVDSETKKATGKGERVIYTQQNPGYDAKCRYHKMPKKIKFDDRKKGLNKFLTILKKAINKGKK